MQKRGSKPVVYFDQNWLSEISRRAQTIGADDQDRVLASFVSYPQQSIEALSEGKIRLPDFTVPSHGICIYTEAT